MSLVGMIKGKGPSGFGYGSSAEDVTEGLDLSGKTILLTGCNSGLGLETLRVLAMRGARVIGSARTKEKAEHACRDATEANGLEQTVPIACELSDPRSVQACVDEVVAMETPLDAIICNAGIMALPKLEQLFGIERQFFTNHVGHFMLVTGLLDQLANAARVVVVSSSAHSAAPEGGIEFDNLSGARNYRGWTAYGQSKLANILFAKELSKRLDRGCTANALHPGVIKTNLVRHMNVAARIGAAVASPIAMKSVGEGAATQVYAATHPSMLTTTGEYLADCNVARSSRYSRDAALAVKLWSKTEEIVDGL